MKTKTRKRQSRRLAVLSIFSSVPLSVFLGAAPAHAQMGLEDDMANESASKARAQQEQYSDYTIKSGDFRMLVSPALSMYYNDNINSTQTGKQDDFIVLPTLGVIMSYPLTEQNLLHVNLTGGYNEYCIHPSLSSWYLASGSGLSFDVYIKDILINLHDQFSYIQDSSQNAAVANTGTYGTFQNSAGLSVNWGLKDIPITVGYDHQNTIATSSQFSDTDNSTETAYARVGYNLNSKFTSGVEGTGAYTSYDQNTLNNNESYSIGVYADWHPDTFLHVEPRVGYVINQYQNTSQDLQTSDMYSWYADLTVSHQITKFLNYSISVGRNVSPGVQSDANEYWYADTSVTWNFLRSFTFQPQFTFQHGTQGQGSTLTPTGILLSQMNNPSLVSTEHYNYYGATIGFGYDISRRFTVNWNYQLTYRTSDVPDRGYTQNVVGIQITYHTI